MSQSALVDQYVAKLTDWRGKTFARVRKVFLEADREIVEEFKWMGTPVWSRDGMIAVANAFKGKVKVTFAYGASLPDPDKIFNADLEGNARRAIDIFEDAKLNERALKTMIRAAIDFNHASLKKNQSKPKKKTPASPRATVRKATKTKTKR